jgi:hypothetical protein
MLPLIVQGLIITGAGQIVRKAGGYVISVAAKNIELAPLVVGTQFFATKRQMSHTTKVGEEIKAEMQAGFDETNNKLIEIITKLDTQGGFQGFQSLQASVGILQASTAVIGVGVAAGVALSAVNLHQTLKLREDVKQLRLEVKEGLIDLKKAFKDQGAEIIQRIDQVAQDVEFRNHRTILALAYGRFNQAVQCLQDAVKLQDEGQRNAQINLAKGMLFDSLAAYETPELLENTSAAGRLRRRECAWAIDQTLTMTYQLQGAYDVVSDRLSSLQDKIRQDSLTVIDRCETEDELDFLFPELTRIHDHDLAVLESWQNHVDWMRSLPPSELKLLQSADFDNSEVMANSDTNADTTVLAAPPEQLVYENLKQKSHPASLQDQLILMMKPSLRQEFASYISQQAAIAGYKTLVPANLQKASDLAVANLYWYFKVRDESEDDAQEEAITA